MTRRAVAWEEEIAQAERDLRSIQMEEDRAIRLFVSREGHRGPAGPSAPVHHRAVGDRQGQAGTICRARAASGTEKRELMEAVLSWVKEVGQGLDELTPEQCQEILQMVVEQVVIDRDNNVDITLAIPIGDDDNSLEPGSPGPETPEPDSVAVASKESSPLLSLSYCNQPPDMSGIQPSRETRSQSREELEVPALGLAASAEPTCAEDGVWPVFREIWK